MKRIVSIALISLVFASCHFGHGERVNGSGNVQKEPRSITGFKGVATQGSIDIIVSQGPYKVEVEADDNLLQYIETVVEGNKLSVGFRDNLWISHHSDVKVFVSAPELTDFETHGSGDVTGNGKISDQSRMNVSVHGSGDIRLALDAPEVRTSIHGSGSIQLMGDTKILLAEIQGSGDIKAGDLKAEDVTVSVHGSGNTDVFASVKLKTTIQGSGDVRYRGTPQLSSETHGSGSVRKVD